MNIIDSAEIKYFRSVYSENLKKLNHLNILVGGNDSGKSNILRALNLFFNGTPSPNEDLDFLADVSHRRQDEARDAKGRLTIWVKITFNNIENWKTLPKKFTIKRTWNRYSRESELSYDKSIMQVNITKFLNKIQFHYVPAVKHHDIYSYYLRKLYETISTDPDIDLGAPADALSKSVNDAVSELSAQVQAKVGTISRINVPTDFGSLFERLHFETFDRDYKIPLSKRGDGIQARHIPHILDYISSRNKKNNIWAYEEPENSLEMSNSYELSDQFESSFCLKNQIFITSHSPAFYGLKGKNCQRYWVKKIDELNGSNKTVCSALEKENIPDQNLGIAALVADRSKALFKDIETQKEKIFELEKLNLPTLITEGITDVGIFQEAQRRLFDEERYSIIACDANPDDSGGHTKLRKFLEAIPHRDKVIRIGVFDRDEAGISSFKSLKGFEAADEAGDFKKRKYGSVFACLLPDVNWNHEFFEIAGRPIAIEQLFAPEIIGNGLITNVFETKSGTISAAEAKEMIGKLGKEKAKKYIECKIRITDKTLAAKRICAAKDQDFEIFRDFFRKISEIAK